MNKLFISDVTMRQEQKRADSAWSFKEKLEIAKALDRLHVSGIELPSIRNEKVDALLVKSIASSVRYSRVILPAALSEEGVEAAWSAVKEAAHPCIQIAVPTSTVQMEYMCHKKPAQMIALIEALVRHAKSLCPEVEFVADDATRSEKAFLYQALETAVSAGADAVTVCDAAGLLLPNEFSDFISDAIAAAPSLKSCMLGVQCSDALSLASANTVSAIAAGAQLIKSAVAQSELLSLESFAEILRARGADCDFSTDLRMTELSRTAKQIDWLTHSKRSAMSPFDSGVQQSADSGVKLDAGSTLTEIISAVRRLGYDLSEEDHAKVYDSFRRIADKKDVGDKELDAIIASVALQVPPTYALDSYVVNSGNIITATAHIKMTRQEKVLQGIAMGDGSIDAAFLAIEQITGHHYELDDFQILAVTEGREAMGSTLVRLRSNGKLYSGKGISTDIIGASIHAYINALNKIVYEETVRP